MRFKPIKTKRRKVIDVQKTFSTTKEIGHTERTRVELGSKIEKGTLTLPG